MVRVVKMGFTQHEKPPANFHPISKTKRGGVNPNLLKARWIIRIYILKHSPKNYIGKALAKKMNNKKYAQRRTELDYYY